MPTRIKFSLKKYAAAVFKPSRKTIKAVKAGLKKPGTIKRRVSNENTANSMAIKIGLDAFGIKDHETRTRIKRKLSAHFDRVKLIHHKGKNSLENHKKLSESENRAKREITGMLGGAKNAYKATILVTSVEAKRHLIKAKLDKK
ncbi:MAG: hypothetical protein ABH986_00185 [archaeon]